jgi:hypothetical protein
MFILQYIFMKENIIYNEKSKNIKFLNKIFQKF